MQIRIEELRHKQVVCVTTGDVLGYVSDIEFGSTDGRVSAIVIFGKPRAFGLFGKYEDIVIPWENIEVVGAETVLVKNDTPFCK